MRNNQVMNQHFSTIFIEILSDLAIIMNIKNEKSNLSLYSLNYAEACNELAGPISASLCPGNTGPAEKMLQRWRAVGNTVSDLTGPRFEPQTSGSRDERVTARPTGRSNIKITRILKKHFLIILSIWPSMNRLLSSRTPSFLTQMDKIRGNSTVLNVFATELDCLQVRLNRIH